MSERLGPLESPCDSPPYIIVRATRRLGYQSPEDVRWCRLSQFLSEVPGWRELLRARAWKQLLGLAPRRGPRDCRCGRPLPGMARYCFTYNTGVERTYLLGQCPRCRTVYWEEG